MDAYVNVAGKKVYAGLSGGVDSAVSAYLLKKAGALVTGVFIKGWYPPGYPCSWKEDRRDAMRAAAHLHIPFVTLDASAAYKQGVIDYLLREYQAGRTPNPDIMCNREVKFGTFYDFAMRSGADYIATGHYAQMNRSALMRGSDAAKDQSYFLWAVPKEAFNHTIFPIGSLPKPDVRKIARGAGLPNARKRDSQGICFLGSISVEDFLTQELGSEQGAALDPQGSVVGAHSGVLLHTIGERVTLTGEYPGPWYVLAKNVATNTLTVSHERTHALPTTAIHLLDTNWLADVAADSLLTAQYRYRGPRIEGHLNTNTLCFTPTHALSETLAQGQSLVVYRGEQCIGGGIIA